MNDERIDELLKDLDAALAVQPSPSVAARVRTRLEKPSGRRAGVWQLTAVAVVAIAAVAYGVSRRVEPAATDQPRQALSTPAAPARATDSAPSPQQRDTANLGPRFPAPDAGAQARADLAEPMRAAKPKEPEVIVSPEIGLAFEQLQAAARSGRLTAESFTSWQPAGEPMIVVPGTIELQVVDIYVVPANEPDATPGPDNPGGSNREPGPMWPNGPLPRTRSAS